MDVRAQLERIASATLAIERRMATRLVPFDGGTAYLDEDFPLRYDANYLLVEATDAALDVAALHADAERILGGAGLGHREVVVPDDEVGQRLALGFAGLDYQAEHAVVMLLTGQPHPRVDGSRAEPIGFEQVRPFLLEVNRRAPWSDGDEETIEALADYRGKLARTIDCSFVAARVDGRVASACELYVEDGVAQVEDVNTLEEYRGQGLASACVMRAVELGRERGAEVVFIEADADDWPQQLYRRLGFADADRYWTFVRWPQHDGRRTRER